MINSPSPSGRDTLNAVSALSPTDVWAVGSFNGAGGVSQTLIEHWNGTSWARVTSPNPGADNALAGVAASSACNAWFAGSSRGPGLAAQALLLHGC